MEIASARLTALAPAILAFSLLGGCTHRDKKPSDHPRLAANTVLRDISFHSPALGRKMTYRVIIPRSNWPQGNLPVVFLLHGGGGDYRDWSNYSDVSKHAATGLILVMPQGDYSYYTNAVSPPANRYEDYISLDLISDVERRFPIARERSRRAIVGVSMGGFGALKIAMDHPALFSFAGGLSPAVDVVRRPFSIRRVQQYQAMEAIFGPWGSTVRQSRDPFLAAMKVQPSTSPYFYLSCGEQEGLLAANREFVSIIAKRGLKHEFHVVPGGHDWNQWNRELDALFSTMAPHFGATSDALVQHSR